jgi:hypothetical protein
MQTKQSNNHPKLAVGKQIVNFMKVRKKWWLAPIMLIVFIFGLLILFSQTSPLAPLLYPLF